MATCVCLKGLSEKADKTKHLFMITFLNLKTNLASTGKLHF